MYQFMFSDFGSEPPLRRARRPFRHRLRLGSGLLAAAFDGWPEPAARRPSILPLPQWNPRGRGSRPAAMTRRTGWSPEPAAQRPGWLLEPAAQRPGWLLEPAAQRPLAAGAGGTTAGSAAEAGGTRPAPRNCLRRDRGNGVPRRRQHFPPSSAGRLVDRMSARQSRDSLIPTRSARNDVTLQPRSGSAGYHVQDLENRPRRYQARRAPPST